ncbi:hypothetical protein [Ideonella alba]|uniref:Uncharacterized protein n=1 Tax=Ideonella alba TaxID=2824118 RepID=A0A940YDK4_9BURK|nr:hypothetical protein [Ideonella alba]MBQ0933658.1 hypothetical protein [Ideonella alba]
MDDFLERIYLDQAKQECEACFEAIKEFNGALERERSKDPFAHATALVHHAAAVSRIFWPPGGRDKHARQRAHRRGEALRKALSVSTDHPVQARTLRDHFEHFDERLDDWAERSKNRNIVRKLLGPRSAIGGDAIQDEDIIHHYDPETKIYAFRGEKFDVQALASGLEDLYAKIAARLAELDRRRFGGDG